MILFPVTYFVYILTNFNNTVLYTGVTNNLERRLYEHKNNENSFTSKYRCFKLIYYEETNQIMSAITREKQIKGLLRIKKDELINAMNPRWEDLLQGALR